MADRITAGTTRILVEGPDEEDEERERRFDLDFLLSLSTAERYKLMFGRSRLMAEMLRASGIRTAASPLKRT